jgi:hypothetical protein
MLILLLLPGCHNNNSGNTLIPAHMGYVNVSELLALHPSWRQAQVLDQLIAEMRQTDRTVSIPCTTEAKMHAPTPLAEVSPQEIQPPAMAGVLAPAFKRIEGLRAMLESQNQKAVDEERKADEQQLLADIAQKKSELANLQAQEEAQQNQSYLEKIRKQQILTIALQTQVRAYQGPLHADAQSRITQANNIIDQLQKELQSKNLLIEAKYAKSLADFQTQRQLALKNQLEELNDRLSAIATQKINKYKSEISVNLNSISSNSDSQAEPVIKPFKEQLSISTPVKHPERYAHTTSFASEAAEIHKLQDQRARLLDYITNDIKRRLEYLSPESGWELTFQPRPGVPDVTAQFENILKNDLFANKMMHGEQAK